MARETKLRARPQDGFVEVQALVSHPMETGLRKDKATGRTIPAHYVQKMTLEHNGKVVADINLGVAISENPLFGLHLPAAKPGDKLKVSWSDNLGETGEAEATVG
jgi:sulfur-oxidizing protein SoxZ